MSSEPRRSTPAAIAFAAGLGVLFWAAGCLTPEGYYRNLDGGGSPTGTGGGAGGSAPGTGGSVVVGTGGATVIGTGGTPATGGRTGTGGTPGTGGVPGTGGSPATGGSTGTGATSGTVIFSDDFESGDSQWITNAVGTASLKTDGSQVYDLSYLMSKVFLSAAGDASWTDVIVQARIKIVSFNGSSSSYYAGLCARLADANNYYCVTLRSDGKVAIRGDIAGSSSSIGDSVTYGVATGTWYTVQLEVVGSTITASINGTPVLPRPAPPPSPTRR